MDIDTALTEIFNWICDLEEWQLTGQVVKSENVFFDYLALHGYEPDEFIHAIYNFTGVYSGEFGAVKHLNLVISSTVMKRPQLS